MKIVAVAFVAIVVAVAGTDHDDDGGHAATGSTCCCRPVQGMNVLYAEAAESTCSTTEGTKFVCIPCSEADENSTTCTLIAERTLMSDGEDGCTISKHLNPVPQWTADNIFKEWDYQGVSGPKNWKYGYEECAGESQSPIDIIETSDAVEKGKKDSIGAHGSYPESATFKLSSSKNAPVFSCASDDCGSFTLDGKKYSLIQFHHHSPCENKVNGVCHPLETHFVHSTEEGELLVVGVLFNHEMSSRQKGKESRIEAFAPEVVAATEDDGVEIEVSPKMWIDMNSGYFHWSGSLTTPPCSENVMWFLSKRQAFLSHENFMEYYEHIGGYPGNSRPVQPLNGRKIVSASP